MDPGLVAVLRTPKAGSVLLLLLGLLAWWPSIHSGYVAYDTDWLVVENPLLNTGEWSNLSLIWTDLSLGVRRTLGSEFLPVRDSTVLFDFALFGPNWTAHHAVNLAWYLAACLLLHRLLLGWLERPSLAWMMAALFLVHPVHVESVVWLASRKDVVSLFFFFSTLWAWERHHRGQRLWLLGSALCMLLACWAKNTAIVLPAVLFVLALGRDRGGWRRGSWWLQWIPFAVVMLVVVWMSLLIGSKVGMFRQPWAEDFWGQLSLQLTLISRYLGMTVWPVGLSAVYELPSSGWDHREPWVGLVALAVLMSMGHRFQKQRPLLAVGLGCFLVCLAPVSPWMSLQNLQADRYLLLPSMGLVLALGAAWRVGQDLDLRAKIGGGVLLFFFGVLTSFRCMDWHDSEALWRAAVEEQPGRVDAWAGLAGVLFDEGARDEAEEVVLQGLEQHPGHPRLLQSLGTLRLQMGPTRWTEAEADLRAALAADPTRMKAGHNLAQLLLKTGRSAEALVVANRLTQSRPGYEKGWIVQGRILMQQGRYIEASESFLMAWQINPYDVETTLKLARASMRAGDEEGARIWSLRTLEIEPGHPVATSRLRELESGP